jgi:thiamine biosynthesis lipoprotein
MLVPPVSSGTLHTPTRFVRHAFVAMGCDCSVVLPAEHRLDALAVEALFEEWNRALSRFDSGSELSRVNASAGAPTPASDVLLRVTLEALRAARATDGLFDPTLEPTMRQLGYDRTFTMIPTQGTPLEPTPPGAAWRDVRVDQEHGTITVPPGSGLDLGGIAKGMAVDAAIARFADRGVTAAVVEAGGDLAVLGLPPGEDAWWVAIDTGRGQRNVAIRAGGLATSGVSRRSWQRGGRIYHHLVDPRTGDSARSDLWSVTAFAATCAQAEVAAKVALLDGREGGAAFLAGIGVSALFVDHVGNETAIGPWEVV